MSKTTFSNKCLILGTLWNEYREEAKENEIWNSFFVWADIGLPLAHFAAEGMATIKSDAKHYVEDTWTEFCNVLDIEQEASYQTLWDCFDASPFDTKEDS